MSKKTVSVMVLGVLLFAQSNMRADELDGAMLAGDVEKVKMLLQGALSRERLTSALERAKKMLSVGGFHEGEKRLGMPGVGIFVAKVPGAGSGAPVAKKESKWDVTRQKLVEIIRLLNDKLLEQ